VMITLCGEIYVRRLNILLILQATSVLTGLHHGRNCTNGFMSARLISSRKLILEMEEVLLLGPMAANIMVNGKITKNMEEDIRCGQTVLLLKENGRMPNSMAGEDTLGQAEVPMKECG
jgi:hypothetical protein